ncbi:hypothetical protein EYB25_001648 [Talaromyces marneffei]|nr:hypothetical protein EYB25_001648 [Talaromyces marneffei]
MDTDYEYPIYGWTATNHHNEALDLFYHRWQTRREAQEIFLEQDTPFLEAEGHQPQQVQVAAGLITQDDAQVAASWNSLWDEEEDSDDIEQEEGSGSFCYCLSPEKVCSMESITSTGGTVVSFSFVSENGRESPSTGAHINEDSPHFGYHLTDQSGASALDLTMPFPPYSHTNPDPSGSSHIVNTDNLTKGKDPDLSGPERSGLPSYDLGRRAAAHSHDQDDPQTDRPTHGTRWEPIRVMLGNWEKEYDVIKPYADYTDVPSPIILPGSPPQPPLKPSLSRFYKVPTVRDPLEDYLKSRRNRNVKEPSPPAPPLQFPEHIATSTNQNQNLRHYHLQRSNSDISFLDLGDPYQPLDAKNLAGDSSAPLSLSISRGVRVSGQSTRGLRARRGLEGANTLSVQIPANNETKRSASGSPQSKEASTTSSLGATFQLDEEMNATQRRSKMTHELLSFSQYDTRL